MKTSEFIKHITTMNASELRTVNKLVIAQLNTLARMSTYKFSVGDQVEFTAKSGKTVQGQIRSIGQKNVILDTLVGAYRVSAESLREVA